VCMVLSAFTVQVALLLDSDVVVQLDGKERHSSGTRRVVNREGELLAKIAVKDAQIARLKETSMPEQWRRETYRETGPAQRVLLHKPTIDTEASRDNSGKTANAQHPSLQSGPEKELSSVSPISEPDSHLSVEAAVDRKLENLKPSGPAPPPQDVQRCLKVLTNAAAHANGEISSMRERRGTLLREAMSAVAHSKDAVHMTTHEEESDGARTKARAGMDSTEIEVDASQGKAKAGLAIRNAESARSREEAQSRAKARAQAKAATKVGTEAATKEGTETATQESTETRATEASSASESSEETDEDAAADTDSEYTSEYEQSKEKEQVKQSEEAFQNDEDYVRQLQKKEGKPEGLTPKTKAGLTDELTGVARAANKQLAACKAKLEESKESDAAKDSQATEAAQSMVEKLTAKKEKWGFLKGAAGAKLARLAGPWSNWVKADGLKQCPKGTLQRCNWEQCECKDEKMETTTHVPVTWSEPRLDNNVWMCQVFSKEEDKKEVEAKGKVMKADEAMKGIEEEGKEAEKEVAKKELEKKADEETNVKATEEEKAVEEEAKKPEPTAKEAKEDAQMKNEMSGDMEKDGDEAQAKAKEEKEEKEDEKKEEKEEKEAKEEKEEKAAAEGNSPEDEKATKDERDEDKKIEKEDEAAKPSKVENELGELMQGDARYGERLVFAHKVNFNTKDKFQLRYPEVFSDNANEEGMWWSKCPMEDDNDEFGDQVSCRESVNRDATGKCLPNKDTGQISHCGWVSAKCHRTSVYFYYSNGSTPTAVVPQTKYLKAHYQASFKKAAVKEEEENQKEEKERRRERRRSGETERGERRRERR